MLQAWLMLYLVQAVQKVKKDQRARSCSACSSLKKVLARSSGKQPAEELYRTAAWAAAAVAAVGVVHRPTTLLAVVDKTYECIIQTALLHTLGSSRNGAEARSLARTWLHEPGVSPRRTPSRSSNEG